MRSSKIFFGLKQRLKPPARAKPAQGLRLLPTKSVTSPCGRTTRQKNTSVLIEGSVKQIQEGTDYVNPTNESFARVSESSKKVGELISEISAASKEQAEGIRQVKQAVSEIDKVIPFDDKDFADF